MVCVEGRVTFPTAESQMDWQEDRVLLSGCVGKGPIGGHKYHIFGSPSYKLCPFQYLLILEHANILWHHTQKP